MSLQIYGYMFQIPLIAYSNTTYYIEPLTAYLATKKQQQIIFPRNEASLYQRC